MKPVVGRLAWLAAIAGVGALAFVLSGRRGDEAAVPQQAAALPAPAPLAAAGAQAEPASAAQAVPASAPVLTAAVPASAVLRRPPADVSRRQRDIQLAVSSDQRGKAGEAAKHIQTCMAAERNAEQRRQRLESILQKEKAPEAVANVLRAGHDELLASCQAVDAAARAQLVPLLRRSLAEGDKGAAAGLVRALGKDFNLADEPGVLPALRRDAWDCDRSSQGALDVLARRDSKLLTPNEIGALRDQLRLERGQSLEAAIRAEADPKRKAILEQLKASYQPPPEADPAEVARISAEIQSRCEAARATLPGGGRPGVPG
ncbi:hypothetical protein [Roseateles sp. LYH14W]|uniref:Uncharacterized protein n=1 Tax=Pelomonas parva TaxID=3299032 RepID=A0ABW7F700_9BURK